MTTCPATLDEYKEAVEAFAREAVSELLTRYATGERGFSIEKHFDRSKAMTTQDGRRLELNWFQLVFQEIVEPKIRGLDGVVAYADNPNIPGNDGSDLIHAHDIMVYRLSSNEERA